MSRRIVLLLSLTLLAGSLAAQSASTPRYSERPTSPWVGTWEVIGTGFDNGARFATITLWQQGEGWNAAVVGPPGSFKCVTILADTAAIEWDLGGQLLKVALVREGDQLHGDWQIGAAGGEVAGQRLPGNAASLN